MFAATRTPPKKQTKVRTGLNAERTSSSVSNVRTSIDDWESGRISPNPPQDTLTNTESLSAASRKTKDPSTIRKTQSEVTVSPPLVPKYGGNRVAEARACLNKAKTSMASSRNTRTDIKEAVFSALDRLFQLVKESELASKENSKELTAEEAVESYTTQPHFPQPAPIQNELAKALKEHERIIKENTKKMEELSEKLSAHQEKVEGITYASVLAGASKCERGLQQTTLHSVVVSSSNEIDTGEQILEKIKKAVNAKEGGIIIDRIRKAKDRKVIIGCRNQIEINRVTERIKEKGQQLNVEGIKNKDPLIVLYNVLQSNSNEDIVEAIKVQNKHLLENLKEEDKRMAIRFRRRARNPLTAHVVATVSPQLWRKLTDAGAVQVDIQRVRVADQSPLIQCSRCLGYGHGRRFCPDTADVCSHCGGQHLRSHCAEWMSETPANCTNCIRAKLVKVEHNAFSAVCPIRKKWETLARSAVAYC